MIDSDSDVILIDSDGDGSVPIGGSAIAPNAAFFGEHPNDNEDDDDSLLSPAPSASVSSRGNVQKKGGCGPVFDVDASIDLDDSDGDAKSSSSSSSSGIPSPYAIKKSLSVAASARPPSVIHMKSPKATKALPKKSKPAKKKSLTNSNKTVNTDETSSCTDMSTSTTSTLSKPREDPPATSAANNTKQSDQSKDTTEAPAKATKQTTKKKKRQWGNSRKKSASKAVSSDCSNSCDSIPSTVNSTKSKSSSSQNNPEETENKHYHCYLLRSLDPDHPLKTYIGFTTHPQRRIRQHNGILKAGGARRTKRSGRPWTFVCVIHGFEDKITALQFEWAWQNVNKSKAFREAVGCDELAKKMKRRYGPKARLDELRILLKECLPFSLYSLTVYFPERKYYDIYTLILQRGKNGNPYKKDDDESEAFEPLMNAEVCALENMPMAREARELKEKKKARKDEERALKQQQKKQQQKGKKKNGEKEKGKEVNDGSDISEWLENDSMEMGWACMDDDSDNDCKVHDDDDESESSNLKTIEENDSSIDLCDSSSSGIEDEEDKLPAASNSTKMVDDISRDLFSLSIDASKKNQQASEESECDFSTISSADSDSVCSIDDDVDANKGASPKRSGKENQQPLVDSAISKASNVRTICNVVDLVDLCDSP